MRPAFGFGVVDYQHASDVGVDSKQTNQEKPIPWGESLELLFWRANLLYLNSYSYSYQWI